MNFTTIKFLCALVGAGAAYQVCPRRLRAWFLLLASYGYYCLAQPRNAILLFASTLITFLVARMAEKLGEEDRKRQLLVWGAVTALVAALFLYKVREAAYPSLLIPLGLSYYTFRLVSYLVDVHWQTMPASRDFVAFAAFSAFFPHIVAGPIHRAESFLPQIDEAKAPGSAQLTEAAHRILLGLFKKFVIADQLAGLVTGAYGNVAGASGTDVWLAFYAFPLQMYADFSGVIDIAVGAAAVFGITSPENFRMPFLASSPSEYWRRWHITLTNWLGDYIFTPLRMGTRTWGTAGLIFSIFVNMIGIGVWHGLQWTFVVFGALHAVWLSLDVLTQKMRKTFLKKNPGMNLAAAIAGTVFTFHAVTLGFVIFRASSIGVVPVLLGRMFAGGASTAEPAVLRSALVALIALVLTDTLEWWRRKHPLPEDLQAWQRWARWSLYGCTVLSWGLALLLIFTLNTKKNPFLYAAF
jgi:alginate O-acetyltransferase complex protein AlgI